jgi:hypothetical protein
MQDPVTDTSQQDITLNPDFINEQVDRLLAWEILQRYFNGEENLPMKPLDLCDKIGVNKGYVHQVITTVRKKLNAERRYF